MTSKEPASQNDDGEAVTFSIEECINLKTVLACAECLTTYLESSETFSKEVRYKVKVV